MASYEAAVNNFRAASGAPEGVSADDMAAMQALLEEDERSPDAFALAEEDSLDYEVTTLPCQGANVALMLKGVRAGHMQKG